MPVLNWIGKEKVVNHDKELPFRVLKPVKELSIGENSENLLIEGDNLEALKALMPFYYGKIKCIYIDPPYNTGNEGWVYNDKVNAPQIKSWLNKAVGAEGEDLCRHDKWLCMMYPRLKLLHQLLSDDGVIFVSIDDNEFHRLRMLMDEIFGELNKVGIFVWRRRQNSDNRNKNGVSEDHEYILSYTKVQAKFKGSSIDTSKYKNPDNDPRGDWMSTDLTGLANVLQRPNLHYAIVDPVTGSKYDPPPQRGWAYSKDRIQRMIENNEILFPSKPTGRPRQKKFLNELLSLNTGFSTWFDAGISNTEGTRVLNSIFGEKVFDFPKPVDLIKILIDQVTNDNDIILDSYAGSGTTGHAVLELNKENGGNRKFILVELEKKIARDIAAKRLTKVVEGFKGATYPEGTGQGFQYIELNGELYNQAGFVNTSAQYEDMAAYIYFTETKNYLDISSIKNPYIGSLGSTNYYLFFEGKGNNILDEKTLKKTEGHKGNKVIYADKCLIDDEQLISLGITFKQIPYELKKY